MGSKDLDPSKWPFHTNYLLTAMILQVISKWANHVKKSTVAEEVNLKETKILQTLRFAILLSKLGADS